jgi:hypothetical protein
MKRALKYLIVVIINLIILSVLLAIWTDSFELTFNSLVRPIEFLKVIGFSIVSLIGIRVFVWIFRKRKIYSIRKKVVISAIVTFLISSYLYVYYCSKIVENRFVNREIRKNIIDKIKPSNGLANGNKADNLTLTEYRFITKSNWFPDLPDSSINIGYIYEYDGFLPDYSFTLIYDLPKGYKIKEIDYQKGDFSKSQTIDLLNDRIRVTYNETEK